MGEKTVRVTHSVVEADFSAFAGYRQEEVIHLHRRGSAGGGIIVSVHVMPQEGGGYKLAFAPGTSWQVRSDVEIDSNLELVSEKPQD